MCCIQCIQDLPLGACSGNMTSTADLSLRLARLRYTACLDTAFLPLITVTRKSFGLIGKERGGYSALTLKDDWVAVNGDSLLNMGIRYLAGNAVSL